MYKNSNGVYYTKALFYEKASDKTNVVYTLKDNEYMSYPSLYTLYMDMEDVTEFEFATKYFANYEHWQLLCSLSWFSPLVDRYRNELELKLKARALKRILAESKGNTRDAYMAAKYVLEKGWDKTTNQKNNIGRPTKDQITKQAKIIASEDTLLDSDFDRILNIQKVNKS